MRQRTIWALGCLLMAGCESPCATDNDCMAGEMCSVETCVPRNAGRDGGDTPRDAEPPAPDAGRVDGGPLDGGPLDGGPLDGGSDVFPAYAWDFVLPALGGFDQARALAVDPTGAVILVGPYSGTPDVAGMQYPSRGDSDVFVVRLTADGDVDWIQTFGSVAADSCRGVATDADGNIYLTGQYQGADVSIAGGPALPYDTDDGRNLFVASLDASGAHRWSAGYVGPGTDSGNAVAVSNEHVFVVGFFSETVALPGGTVTSAGGRDMMVLDYDRSGSARWQRTYGGTGEDGAWDVAAADNDKAYLTGYFAETVTFGALGERTAVAAAGETGLFALKINEDGLERQVASFGASDGSATGRSITITESRGALVGGIFEGTLALPGVTPTSDSSDGILLRLDNALAFRWHQVVGGPGTARVLGVAYGAGEQGFAIGQFSERVTGWGDDLVGLGESDIFVLAFDDTGMPRWARSWGSDAGDWGWGAEVSGDRLHTGGALRGDTDFGGGVRAFPEGEAFVASYRVR